MHPKGTVMELVSLEIYLHIHYMDDANMSVFSLPYQDLNKPKMFLLEFVCITMLSFCCIAKQISCVCACVYIYIYTHAHTHIYILFFGLHSHLGQHRTKQSFHTKPRIFQILRHFISLTTIPNFQVLKLWPTEENQLV